MIKSDSESAINSLITKLEDFITPDYEKEKQFYEYVSLPTKEFLCGLEICSEYLLDRYKYWPTDGFKFLDAGCGIGTKLILARLYGFDVFGIEINKELAKIAKNLTNENIQVNNIFNIKDFSKFNVIYSYRLCKDLQQQHQLEKYISSTMKSGSLLFITGSTVKHLKHINDQVWVIE